MTPEQLEKITALLNKRGFKEQKMAKVFG